MTNRACALCRIPLSVIHYWINTSIGPCHKACAEQAGFVAVAPRESQT